MDRVFFNIRLDEAFLPERTGQCVASLDEAREVARTIVRRLVTHHGGEPRLLNAAMVVTDETGATVLELSFFEALYVPVEAPETPVVPLGRAVSVRAPRPSTRLRARISGLEARSQRLVQALLQALLHAGRRNPLARVVPRLPAWIRLPRGRYGLGLEAST
ncbi:DUF6894 family protein [Methylobacterium sp. A54F]